MRNGGPALSILEPLRTHLRFNWRRWAILVGSGALAFLFVRGGVSANAGSFESSLCLVLAGAALTAAGKAAVDLATRSEAYRQGAYTERAKAVQSVLRFARDLKTRRIDNLIGRLAFVQINPAAVLRDHEEIMESLSVELLRETLDVLVWIGRSGEAAVREYVLALGLAREVHRAERTWAHEKAERARLEVELGATFEVLERALMADLDYTPE